MNIATAYVELRTDSSKGKAEAKSEARKIAKAAGTADVPLSAKAGPRELGQARTAGKQIAGEVVKAAAGIFAAGAIFAGLNKAIGAASSLEQAVGGTAAVFGKASGQIDRFAKSAAEMVGLSERSARELTTQLGGALKGLGFSLEDATTKSIDLVKVGADLAATFGGTTAQAVEAIGAGFRGEFESLEQFNVFLKQSTVNAKAVELGLATTTSEVDDNARAQATLALIMGQSTDALGQFGRESDTTAVKAQVAAAKMEESAASLGQKLAPVYNQIVDVVGKAADVFATLPGPVQLGVVALAGFVALAGPLKNVLDLMRAGGTSFASFGKGAAVLGGVGIAAVSLIAIFKDLTGEALNFQAALDRDTANNAEKLAEIIFQAGQKGIDASIGLSAAFTQAAKDGAALFTDTIEGVPVEVFAADIARLGLTIDEFVAILMGGDTALAAFATQLAAEGDTAGEVDYKVAKLRGVVAAYGDAAAIAEGKSADLSSVLGDTGGAAGDTALDIDNLSDSLAMLLGQFSDESAFIDLQDGFADARQSLTDFLTKFAEEGTTAEENAAGLRAHRQDQLKLIDAVVAYADEVGDVPEEAITEIIADINEGDLAEAERKLNELETERVVNLRIQSYNAGSGFLGRDKDAPGLAAGGIIRARSGGLPATIGEGGVDEAVIPLTTATLAAIGEAIASAGAASAKGGGGGQQTFGGQVESLSTMLSIVRELGSSGIAQRSGSRGLASSLTAYARAVRLAGDDVRDYQEDVIDLAAAQDAVLTSAVSLSEITARQAELTALAAGETFTAADAAAAQAAKLREIAETLPAGSALVEQLLAMAGGLDAVAASSEKAETALTNVLDISRASTDADADAAQGMIDLERATLRFAEASAHAGEGRLQELDLADASLSVVEQAQKLADVRVQQGLADANTAGRDFTSADAARIQATELRRLAAGISETPGFEAMVQRLLDLAQIADVAAASADASSIILNKRAAGGPVGPGDFMVGERGNGAEWLHLEPGSRGYVTNARDSVSAGLSIGTLVVGDRRDLPDVRAELDRLIWRSRF